MPKGPGGYAMVASAIASTSSCSTRTSAGVAALSSRPDSPSPRSGHRGDMGPQGEIQHYRNTMAALRQLVLVAPLKLNRLPCPEKARPRLSSLAPRQVQENAAPHTGAIEDRLAALLGAM